MGKNYAIILAGGRGSRMGSDKPKQYLELCDKPVLYYSLKTFSECDCVDSIVLVTGSDEDAKYCRDEILERYNIEKTDHITVGGAERYDSVYSGLGCIDDADYVMIHDSARCLIDKDTIERTLLSAREYGAAVAAVPVKDTIKRSDPNGFASETLNRDELWQIQTPQTFSFRLVKEAYQKMMSDPDRSGITDDAMVVERYTDASVRLVMGDYRNIKITTPEDMIVAEAIMRSLGR